MNQSTTLVIIFLIALLTSAFLSRALIPIAHRYRLLDIPCSRKQHNGSIPLVGGISIFITTAVMLLGFISTEEGARLFVVASALMVFIGVLDDKHDLSVRLRIVAQLLVALIIVFGAETYITNLGNLVGLGDIKLGVWGIPFTLLAIMAAMNAYNMVDGIDGLLGGLSFISFAAIAFLGYAHGNDFVHTTSMVIAAALIPFIARNTSFPFKNVRKVFMGDAGSMFIGLAIVWLLTLLTQPSLQTNESTPVRPVIVLWFIAVPLMDMLAIMFRRAAKGQSPFKPDRNHLHHIFMRAGLTSREALLFILSIALIKALLGIALELFYVADWIVLGLYVSVFVFYCYLIKHAWKVVTWVKRRSKPETKVKD